LGFDHDILLIAVGTSKGEKIVGALTFKFFGSVGIVEFLFFQSEITIHIVIVVDFLMRIDLRFLNKYLFFKL
jgi:hypothetical protein